MIFFTNLIANQFQNSNQKPRALCIGKFDCIHLGHQRILRKMAQYATSQNLRPTVLTFLPQPQYFFTKNPNLLPVLTLRDKIHYIKQTIGADCDIIIQKFNKAFSDMEAKQFITNILDETLNTKAVFVGNNFCFGKNQGGCANDIQQHGIKTFAHSIENIENAPISTSNIRNAIRRGDIITAVKLLGRNYHISGTVTRGLEIAGTSLGFKTANILPRFKSLTLPQFGVYKTLTIVNGVTHRSVSNFGIKPTILTTEKPTLETHILDFNNNLYGQNITIEFIDFIREERKFDSLDALKNDIVRCVEISRN